jgi:hypothetical protein
MASGFFRLRLTLPLPAQQAWFERLRFGSRSPPPKGVALAAAERRQIARHVDAGVGLDLVHLGAEKGEGLAHDGTGPHPAEVRNADALQGERLCHEPLLDCFEIAGR